MKKRIFLTGGTGFIGKNFIEQRKDKYIILSPTHKELDLTDTMTVDYYFKKKGIFDVVIHCANIGGKRSDTFTNIMQTNLRMFFNLVRNKTYFKKMIHIGTGAEYDKSRDLKNVKETYFDKLIPKDDHSFSKYVISKYILYYEDIYCLRIFGIFGRYEEYKLRLISNLICKYILHLPLTMIQDAYFDFVYINDFVKILDYFINNNPKYKFYNIGTGKRTSLLSLAKIISKLNTYSMPLKIQKKGLNKEYTCNNSRLMNELKNFTFTNIDDSIKELYNWYRKNWRGINKKAIITDAFNRP